MRYNHKFKNLLKAAVVLSIAFAFIMPASAALFNVSNKEPKKLPRNFGTISITIYVDDDNTEGPWDGTIDYPYQYIQDGIDNANNDDDIHVFSGVYFENIVIFKTVCVIGESKSSTIIDGSENGNTVTFTADGIYLSGFTIINSGGNPNDAGIIVHSQYNEIIANNIQNNNIGIKLADSENEIIYNNFFNNIIDAYDEYCNTIEYNFWDEYLGEDEDEDGVGDIPYNITGDNNKDWNPLIHIYDSIQNMDTEEIFLTIQDAIDDSDTEEGHTIFVKSDVYYEHVEIWKSINLIGEINENTIIDGREIGIVIRINNEQRDDYSVYLAGFTIRNSGYEYTDAGIKVTSDGNTITENIIENNYHGIYLKHSSDDNEISHNMIRNNNWNGIYVKSICLINDGNIICANAIENNNYAGIAMEGSSYNHIYYNNVIGNTHNAYDDSNNIWDDDYPSGGNYWDDYTGGDANGDGIGDTPYEIDDGINEDKYPLIEPYGSGDPTPPDVEIVSPQNGLYLRNLRLLSGLLKQRTIIFGSIDIEVEASDYSGIEKVEFYIDDGSSPERIVYEEPYIWEWEDRFLLKTKHEIIVVAYDNEGNHNIDLIEVRKFF